MPSLLFFTCTMLVYSLIWWRTQADVSDLAAWSYSCCLEEGQRLRSLYTCTQEVINVCIPCPQPMQTSLFLFADTHRPGRDCTVERSDKDKGLDLHITEGHESGSVGGTEPPACPHVLLWAGKQSWKSGRRASDLCRPHWSPHTLNLAFLSSDGSTRRDKGTPVPSEERCSQAFAPPCPDFSTCERNLP